jgi:hypothetical protein
MSAYKTSLQPEQKPNLINEAFSQEKFSQYELLIAG